jgi:hypothetical protein
MASAVKFHQFPEDMAHKVHDLSSDQLKIALLAAANAPSASGDAVLADLTEISYTNLVSQNLTVASSGQVSGQYRLAITDFDIEASGGSVGPFRYVVIYNDTPTSPADPLMYYYDRGSEVTLADGEKITIDFAAISATLE